MSEIDWTREEHWRLLEDMKVIEWAPDKSEFFITEKMQTSLKKAREYLVSKGIPFNDISDDIELTDLCTVATIAHLETATPEETHFLADFLFRSHNAQYIKMKMADRVIRPGIKWPKMAVEG